MKLITIINVLFLQKKIAKEIRWECYCKTDICNNDQIIITNQSITGNGKWINY